MEAVALAENWLQRYGQRRADFGYVDNTPINKLLRNRELGTALVRTTFRDYQQNMLAIGRDVMDPRLSERLSRWRRDWNEPPSPVWQPNPPVGIHGPGWLDRNPVSSATSTSSTTASTSAGMTGDVMFTHSNELHNRSNRKRTGGVMVPSNMQSFMSTGRTSQGTGGANEGTGMTRNREGTDQGSEETGGPTKKIKEEQK